MKEYQIPVSGLKLDTAYAFDYRVTGTFFKNFEHSIIDDCNLFISIELEKKTSFYRAVLGVKGFIKVPCDRCTENFDLQLDLEYPIIIKKESERKTDSDDNIDLMFIPTDAVYIDAATWIYEYSNLSIPMRKVHPFDENGEPNCPSYISEYIQEEQEEQTDSRWDALKDIKID